MSTKKILFLAAAIALLAAGCSSQTGSSTSVNTPQAPVPAAQNTPSGTAPADQTSSGNAAPVPIVNAQTSSNASLNSSLSGIDTQMNNLNTDSANADAGLNQQTAP